MSDPSARFTLDDRQRLEDLEAQVARLLSDSQLGRAMQGPVWLSGASIINGTVTADKVSVNSLAALSIATGALNVTGNITAASSFPATGARVVLSQQGLFGYNGATTTTFELKVDGSGKLGSGSTAVTWSTSGVVSIPKAAIGSLTISDIGGGTFGGTYQSGSSAPRMELGTFGLRLIAAGNVTVAELATSDNGDFTLRTGPDSTQRIVMSRDGFYLMPANQTNTANALVSINSSGFMIRTATTGSRVEISGNGIEAYDGNTKTVAITTSGRFELASSLSGQRVILTASSANADQNGLFIYNSSGTLTAALRADGSGFLGVTGGQNSITWGTNGGLTIRAETITAGSMAADRIAGGTLGGSFNIGSANSITTSNGRINFGNDYITDNLIHFNVAITETVAIRAQPQDNRDTNHGAVEMSMWCSIINHANARIRASTGTSASSPYADLMLYGISTGSWASLKARGTSDSAAAEFFVSSSTPRGATLTIDGTARFYVTDTLVYMNTNAQVNGNLTVSSQLSAGTIPNVNFNATYSIKLKSGSDPDGIELAVGNWNFTNIAGDLTNPATWNGTPTPGYIKIFVSGTEYRIPVYKI